MAFCKHIAFLTTAAGIALACAARAEVPVYANGPFSVGAGLEAGLYLGHFSNANFGGGVIDARSLTARPGRPNFAEGYLSPELSLRYDTATRGTVYGGLVGVLAATRANGDLGGFSRGGEEAAELDQHYVGWRSGGALPALGQDALDISVGARDVFIGDGFLIWDGNAEAFDDAAVWLGPRDAFERTARVKLDTARWRTNLLYLRADYENDDAELAGLDVEIGRADGARAAIGWYTILDAANRFNTRDGMDIADIRVAALPVPGVQGLSFTGEYVRQYGHGQGATFQAAGWHTTLRYDVPGAAWQPYFRLRRARFGGEHPGTSRREAYDPLFYGYSDDGDWFLGEVLGNGLLFNSNQRVTMVQAGAWPREWLKLDAFYWRVDLDRYAFSGTPVTTRRFADEINLMAQIFPADWLWLGLVYSAVSPDTAACEALGRSKTTHAIEFFAVVNF